MTLYYNLLEKRMKDQPLPHGIPMFWNSPKKVETDFYSPSAKFETAPNWQNNSVTNYTQPGFQEAAEIKPENNKSTKRHYKGPQPGGVKVTTQAIIDCANDSIAINALTAGVVAKIPVVLAELTIQLNVNSIVELPDWAHEIKKIKRNLKITQCVLLHNTNILFIKGFVRKNIEYTTENYEYAGGTYGDIRHCIVEVPFDCTTNISFNGIEPAPLNSNTSKEFKFLKRAEDISSGIPEKDELLFNDISELNLVSTAFYNELPFCELTSSKIVEFYEVLNPPISNPAVYHHETPFNSMEEKMVIYLTLKILQYRKVAIHPIDSK